MSFWKDADGEVVEKYARENLGKYANYVAGGHGPWRIVGYSLGITVPDTWFVALEMKEGETGGNQVKNVPHAHYLTAPTAGRNIYLVRPGALKLCEPATDPKRFPHKCPRTGCGAPAYLGFNSIECSRKECNP